MSASVVIIDDNIFFAESLRKAISERIFSLLAENIALLPDGKIKDEETIVKFLSERKEKIRTVIINANLKLSIMDMRIAHRGFELYKKITKLGLTVYFRVILLSFESLDRLRKIDKFQILDERHIYWHPFIHMPFCVRALMKVLLEEEK